MGLSGWNSSQRLKLIIDNSKVDENLIDFPVNITLSSGTGQTGFDATAVFDELSTVSGTKKIAITTTVSGIETELYTEIERWDWVNEKANLWVKVPTVSSGTNTELHLYYDSDHADNTDYIGNTCDSAAQSVWDNHFKAVYHMAQDPNGDAANAIKDSTSNANEGTPGGGMTSADLVDGKIGKGIDFDGVDDEIEIADANIFDATQITLEAIIKPVSVASRFNIIQHIDYIDVGNNGGYGLSCAIDTSGEYRLSCYNNAVTKVNYTNIGVDVYKYLVGTYDDTDLDIYMDGVLENTNSAGASKIRADQSALVQISHGTWTISGIVEEARISNTARSAAWIKATYYSNWDDFITFSEEEIVIFTFTNPIPTHLSTVYGTTKQLQLTTTVNGIEESYIYDATFYDGFDMQIGTTISGINSGSLAISNAYLPTPSGVDYSWYVTATSSGSEDTSSTYTFFNRFLYEGYITENGDPVSRIVRLYYRNTGELIDSTTSSETSGYYSIDATANDEHFVVAFDDEAGEDYNSLILDKLLPKDTD